MVNFSFSAIWIVQLEGFTVTTTLHSKPLICSGTIWMRVLSLCKVFCTHFLTGYICYDDGCHLSKYATNPCRRDLTPTTQAISQMSIVIDKMHMAGHVDAWCKENCDPHKFRDLDKVCS